MATLDEIIKRQRERDKRDPKDYDPGRFLEGIDDWAKSVSSWPDMEEPARKWLERRLRHPINTEIYGSS